MNMDDYTDEELIEWLDLNNPTDRELEARILQLIDQYQNTGDDEFIHFLMQVYEHFFETSPHDEDANFVEGFTTEPTSTTPETQTQTQSQSQTSSQSQPQPESQSQTSQNQSQNQTQLQSQPQSSSITNPPQDLITTTPGTTSAASTGNSLFTKTLDYAKGTVNPLLKETITRIISIDSQFRDSSVYKYSTDYTFNLSETLRNVVSIKLYSIQIPYTWYIISDNYGSNFYYIKGNTVGINNGFHDYQVVVENGNTTIDKLVLDISASMSKVAAANPGVNFGTTGISYNSTNTKATMTFDIRNTFTTQYYSLIFPDVSSTTVIPGNQVHSIGELFGFQQSTYYPFRAYSTQFALSSPQATVPTSTYYMIDTTNNYFDITIYQSTVQIEPIFTGSNIKIPQASSFNPQQTNSIIKTIRIQLSLLGQYNANDIYNDLNIQLQNTPELVNDTTQMFSQIFLENMPDSSVFRYCLQLRFHRSIGWQCLDENVKVVVVFPNSTDDVWTGINSCFKFAYSPNGYEMSNIQGETPIDKVSFVVQSSPYIQLKCIAPYYGSDASGNVIDLNDIPAISIPNSTTISPTNSYSLDNYYTQINKSIANAPPIANTNVQGTIYNVPINANNYTQIAFNILRIIPTTNFYIDIGTSILKDWGFPQYLYGNAGTPYVIEKSYVSNGYAITEDNNIIYILSDPTGAAQFLPPTPVKICDAGNKNLSTAQIVSYVNEKLNAFKTNNIYLADCNMSYDHKPSSLKDTVSFSLNIQAVLTQSDYEVIFGDENPVSSGSGTPPTSWMTNFGFSSTPYSMAAKNTITGTVANTDKKINLDSTNNYFYIRPIYNPLGGVYDTTLAHQIKVVLDLSANLNVLYSAEQIRNSINNVLNAPGSLLRGSFLNTNGTNAVFRLNVNKTFHSKDYNLVFYDSTFVKCDYGSNASITTTTADSTLGWLLGYRQELVYSLNPDILLTDYELNVSTYDQSNNIATIQSDTSISLNLYNYLLLILDDYTQNHLNDGLVTTITPDLDIAPPVYVNPRIMQCNPATGTPIAPFYRNLSTPNERLTNSQIYSAEQILNTQNIKTQRNTFSKGPFIQDIFGLIPIKTSGMTNGQTYVELGGTLQLQERTYFGPVNIRRMSVKLMTDKGNVLNLNGQNWSFSLIVQQLYTSQ